ncbi:MAG: hypothetical protein M1822_003249 [Bathelium mastoideum]|nr:MAG: hypothetical protein M1822_003249 [Bathelium mastoideum]
MSSGFGLVGYESSDEESQNELIVNQKESDKHRQPSPRTERSVNHAREANIAQPPLAPQNEPSTRPSVSEVKEPPIPNSSETRTGVPDTERPVPLPTRLSHDSPVSGPALGPAGPSTEETMDESNLDPQSPYSATRSQLRNLTMPPVPNFSIPPSPPGSPPPEVTKKFEQFLELKQKGKHFNENLANSSALRNPTLLQKLMGFAGISEEDQYATTLPPETAIPTQVPEWAYGDQLDKAQKAITKKREEEAARKQRDSVAFVKASGSGGSSRSTTPGTAPRAGQSTAERVMAELDKKGPQPQTKAGDRRGGRTGSSKNRFDQRPRSPR